MFKQEMIDKLIEKTGEKKAEKVLNAFIEIVTEAVAAGDKVNLRNFGVFEARNRAARIGHNPLNGEEIQIPASKVPVFKPGKEFKKAVNI